MKAAPAESAVPRINRTLKHNQRQQVIDRALDLARRLKELHHRHPGFKPAELAAAEPGLDLACPLVEGGECLVFADRPARCRYFDLGVDDARLVTLTRAIDELSLQAYWTLTGQDPPAAPLGFSSADTISGKFVQLYFQAMAKEVG